MNTFFTAAPSIADLPVLSVQIFVDDPSVLFVSTHQSGGYPGTGRISEAGSGDGLGATINIPLPGYSCPPSPRPYTKVICCDDRVDDLGLGYIYHTERVR